MAEAKYVFQPVCDCRIELIQFAGKKVVRAFDNNKMILTGQ